eukprot:gnl/TRDRNA2_/TRDRNA2_169755_c0_seq6.p1 gnl/TRDRNA2_/TRDRNA2_169755_c0~~gnl/TRDRNA2_/TRDRNA2_169755_c0_seq6.p1  ORF type:complete len:226 (+),score=8.98 gnl/TRDRNA2_/TRDRNA2_169755_c0_seq6:620-1297(+)
MLYGVTFHDYVDPRPEHKTEDAFFIFTGAVELDPGSVSLRHRNSYMSRRKGHQLPHLKTSRAYATCPEMLHKDGWNLENDLWRIRDFIKRKCHTRKPVGMMKSYFKEFNLPAQMGRIVYFAQGARFGVSRARIRQRPLRFYKKLLDHVSGDPHPCMNLLNEYFWYYIMGRPTHPPCNGTYLDLPVGRPLFNDAMITANTERDQFAKHMDPSVELTVKMMDQAVQA